MPVRLISALADAPAAVATGAPTVYARRQLHTGRSLMPVRLSSARAGALLSHRDTRTVRAPVPYSRQRLQLETIRGLGERTRSPPRWRLKKSPRLPGPPLLLSPSLWPRTVSICGSVKVRMIFARACFRASLSRKWVVGSFYAGLWIA